MSMDAMDNKLVPGLRAFVEARITERAKAGVRSLISPLAGVRGGYSPDVLRSLWHSLAMDGFQVIHHPDPDPGDPRSGPYTEIRW